MSEKCIIRFKNLPRRKTNKRKSKTLHTTRVESESLIIVSNFEASPAATGCCVEETLWCCTENKNIENTEKVEKNPTV